MIRKENVMANKNDVIRKASLFTMNGLIDPRLLEPLPESHGLLNVSSRRRLVQYRKGIVEKVRNIQLYLDTLISRAMRRKNAH